MTIFNPSEYQEEYVIGADEVGTGTIAGPIVVVGVLAKRDWTYPGLNDSKQLSEKQREKLEILLKDNKDIVFHIAERSSKDVDESFSGALKSAYFEVYENLYKKAVGSVLFIADGKLKIDTSAICKSQFISFVKGDTYIPHVMVASILAKTYRDAQMRELHKQFPNYSWDDNKGYGTKKHLDAIEKYGVSDLHRKSFAPIKKILANERN